MREAQKLLLVLAGGLFTLGLVLGLFMPVHVDSQKCGTAFRDRILTSGACDESRAEAKTLPVSLIGLSLIAALGAVVTRSGA